jgi:hypothetical protein
VPALTFSGPNLAVAAYAEIEGIAGASTMTNSGVRTTRVGQGRYVVVLPPDQFTHGLILIQPKVHATDTQPNPAGLVAKMSVVDDNLEATKTIQIFSGNPAAAGSTGIDSDFSFLLLKTVLPSEMEAEDEEGVAPAPPPPPPLPPAPPAGGLAWWLGGDGSVITSQTDPNDDERLLQWTNLTYPINGHAFQLLSDINGPPYTGLDELDGHPSVTWRSDVDHTQIAFVDTVPASQNQTPMKATDGSEFGYGLGENQPRSAIFVLTPRFAPDAFSITGGAVAAWFSSQFFTPLFNLEDNITPNAFYAFTSRFDWRNHIGEAVVLDGPDTAGGIGGIYNNTPLIVEYSTSGGTDIHFFVNGVAIALTPNTITPSSNSANQFVLGSSTGGSNDKPERWKGTMTEVLVYDYELTTTPALRTQLYRYLALRYPSINTVIP